MSTTTTTKTQSPTVEFPSMKDLGGKTLEAVSALAEANQRVAAQLIELSSTTATDRLRMLGELQSAAVEAARGAFAPMNPREAIDELRQDPLAWYRMGVASMLDGTQRMAKLFESNAQIMSRNAERVSGEAERTGKEIEKAVSTCASRLREIYGGRS
jgi:hypothetical protein